MRIRTFLVVLGLLLFIICTVSPGQAALSRKNNLNYLALPNEHPWQHEGSPGDQDTLSPSPIGGVIVPLAPGIRAILFIQTHIGIKGYGKNAQGINASEGNKRHSTGGR